MNISEDRKCELYVFNENNKELYKYSLKDTSINYSIDNAIKYSIPNTKILVKSFLNDNLYNFTVENYSYEISNEGINKIFKPFYRENIKKSRMLGSNRLGLFICSKLVEKYNGVINFNYNDGKVLVTVELPIHI